VCDEGDGFKTNTRFSHGLLERLVREQYVTTQPTMKALPFVLLGMELRQTAFVELSRGGLLA
jgi:hypothetical protein